MSTNPIDNNLPPERVLEGLINEMSRGLSQVENNLYILDRIVDEDKRKIRIEVGMSSLKFMRSALVSAEEYLHSYKEDE